MLNFSKFSECFLHATPHHVARHILHAHCHRRKPGLDDYKLKTHWQELIDGMHFILFTLRAEHLRIKCILVAKVKNLFRHLATEIASTDCRL